MEINSIGGVTIQFNRDVKIPTYFNSFNQSIIELKLITQKFNSSLKASRMLSAESGGLQETSEQILDFEWTIKQFSARKFFIDLSFDKPLEVSSNVRFLLIKK